MPTARQSPPNADRTFLSTLAVLLASGAFILAMIGLIAVSTSSGSSKTSNVAAAAPTHVDLSEFKISPAKITMALGGKLHLTNSGTQVHNLLVTEGNIKSPDIKPGGSTELDLSALKEGTYNVSCQIPGHADSGMKATMVVSKDAAGTQEVAAGSHSQASDSGSSSSGDHDWAAMDKAMADGVDTYLNSLKADAKPLTAGQGNQKLTPTIAADGTKEFSLEASIVDWETEPGKVVKAWAFNKMVPAPWIRVEPGDKVRIKYTNNLPAGSDIHWHGISTPFSQDGVAPLTQPMVKPGETYTYEFTLPNHPELGMYHPHNHGEIAIPNGMFGIFQVGDIPMPKAGIVGGKAVPAVAKPTQEVPMVLNDAGVIGLTLNGKAFPATGATVAKPGDAVLIHYYNEGLQVHPMHLHRIPQLIIAKDGIPLDQPYWADTIAIAPGERYSAMVFPTTDDIGAWAWHCHIVSHAESDKGLSGMVTAFVVPDPNKPA